MDIAHMPFNSAMPTTAMFWILDLSVNKNFKAIGHGTSSPSVKFRYSFCKAIFAFDWLRLVA